MENFSDNLRAARLAAGLRQKEVAKLIGVSEPTYSLYENGKCEPTLNGVKNIATALGVSTDTLLGMPQGGVRIAPEDYALLSMVQELNALGRRKVMEYVSDIYDRYRRL